MADNPQQIVRGLRTTLKQLELDLNSTPDASWSLDHSIREAHEVVRKLKQLRQARARQQDRATPPAPSAIEVLHHALGAALQKREYVVLALEELGSPASPAFISALIKRLWNADVAATQFASIRKGDERAWLRGRRTRPLIVPALNAFDLSPRPRTCALSLWPAERRVMGTLSDRADALRILLAAARRADQQGSEAWRTTTVTLAADFRLSKREMPEIAEAAQAALAAIEAEDAQARKDAAERLRRLPSEQWQLFGRPVTFGLVEGGKHA